MTAPTTEPVTWQILQNIGGLLTQISVVNGFYTDAGANVIYDNRALDKNDVFPTLRVNEIKTDTPRSGSVSRNVTIDIAIECYINADATNAQLNAHRVRSDVMACMPGKIAGLKLYALDVQSRNIIQRPAGIPFVVVEIILQAAMTEQTAIRHT